jgi:hypothetical protein
MKYEDLYYAALIVRKFATGELTSPGLFVADIDYFMAIADELQEACELQGGVFGATIDLRNA